MRLIELACAAIVALYLFLRLRAARPDERGAIARRLAILLLASFLGEDTCIRAYRFYHYAPGWDLFVDQVPLFIVVIWPVVVDSAWQLAKRLAGARVSWVPLFAALIVLADASLIEPIAVRAGLWSWSAPGLFAVPPIGILGWSFFALSAIALVERAGFATLLLAPLFTHLLLLVSWWGALRWMSGSIAPWHGALVAWLVLAPLALFFWSRKLRARVPIGELLVRVPGAIFFFALLALFARQDRALVAWACAFAPPYLALLNFS
ncbi:MAG: hypothetical protein ACHQ17_06385 [Polyangia bacterium]|jgi:hypothetical protein